jgi:hypothetical protein
VKQNTESTKTTSQEEWKFLRILAPGIRVDQDGNGRLIFRRGDYGLVMTKEEAIKCVNMVVPNRSVEENINGIEFQAHCRNDPNLVIFSNTKTREI